MLEELLKLVKENAGDAIINNPAIPNKKNDAVCKAATKSLMDKMKGIAGTEGMDSITKLFNEGGDLNNNTTINNISDGVAGDLMKKFKLDGNVAGTLVKSLIPVVLGKLISKTNDPNDNSFSLESVIGMLAGGSGAGGFLGKLKSSFGGK